MSSLAECVTLGHQHPAVVRAIREQAETLCFVTAAWGAEPRARLAERLLEKSGFTGGRVFFTLGGADANEHAVKFARQASGKPRGWVVGRDRSYHGASYATMAFSRDARTQHLVDPAEWRAVHVPPPYAYRCPFGSASEDECAERAARSVGEAIDARGAGDVAAVLMEPNAGTNGIVAPDRYWPLLREETRRRGVFLIADEVMSAFGRCGEWFAWQRHGEAGRPDIMTLAKGLTGAHIPLGAVVLSREVAARLENEMLPTGLTYCGHPLACAAGVAALQAYEDEGLIERSRDPGGPDAGDAAGHAGPRARDRRRARRARALRGGGAREGPGDAGAGLALAPGPPLAPGLRGEGPGGGGLLRGAGQSRHPRASPRDRGGGSHGRARPDGAPAHGAVLVMTFKLTYSTMFDPPEEMHTRFEAALDEVRKGFGATHALSVDGRDVASARTWEKRSPVDQRVVLGHFALGDAADVDRAVAAAKKAFDGWRTTPAAERVRLMKRVAALLEERVFTIGAVLALEVGKNRMEALGETQETADFFSGYAAEVERNEAYDHVLPDDPLPGFRSHNRSIMKPYGVWGVITPFNFPLALAGGPVAAALVTGNTVVLKGATDTPWAGRLLADCLRDAGLPAGVFNYVTGSGRVVGEALASHPDLAGLTFTGSHEVGMGLYRKMAAGPYPRPCITEMGGKNPCVVTARGDLERAATGIVRSAYGLTGQKCSALSRVYVEEGVADALLAKVVEKTRGHPGGRPLRAGELDGSRDQRGRGRELRALLRAAPGARRPDPRRRDAPHRRRPRPRLLRGAHGGRGAPGPPALPGGDVPADRDGGPGEGPPRGRGPRQRHARSA